MNQYTHTHTHTRPLSFTDTTVQVHPIGFGCMNIDHAYGPSVDDAQGERILHGALDAGYNFLDTATLYGFGRNETRMGKVLKARRSEYVLASKCGMGGVKGLDGITRRVIDGTPANIKAQCEASLQRLQTDVIDLYYLHRWHKAVPIEDSVGALADLVREGKIRSIGLSEVSASTLRKAHAVHPIAAVQTEYSLWTRNPEIAVLQACAELGTAFVAFSPVARGYLCGLQGINGLDAKDIRRTMPRFADENYAKNLALMPSYASIAAQVGCTPAQLALAWLLHQAPHMIAIPGTTQFAHMQDNLAAANIVLDAATLAQLNALFEPSRIVGDRYDAQAQSEVDTESFA
jgi:aryl-alcohol dehydrogenase-like predicted oxidoreductase